MTDLIVNQQPQIAQGFMANQQLTMSSREISELTGKQHQHVKRDIENMLDGLGEDASSFGHIYFDSMNREQREYRLDRLHVECLLTGYSVPLRMAVLKRLKDLESQRMIALPDFTNPAVAARAWADEVEAKQVALLHLEQAKPAVQFVDKYVDSTGLKSFREVCKILQANESRFREFLADHKVMYRLNGGWVPYQCHIDAGRLSVKTGVSERNGYAFTDVKFTPKGVNWIAGEWGKYQIQGEVA